MKGLFQYFKDNSFIKENKEWIKNNNALFIAICTFFLAIGSYFVKFVIFVYMRGSLSYWNIPVEYIKFENTSSIGDLAFYAFIVLYIFVLIVILKKLIHFGLNNFRKNILSIVFVLFDFLFALFIGTIMNAIPIYLLINSISFANSLLTGLLVSIYLLLASCFKYWVNNNFIKQKRKEQNNSKHDKSKSIKSFSLTAIIIYLALFCIGLMYVHRYGVINASNQDVFDLVEDKTYAVIHSYEDDYLLLACEVDETTNTIIIDTDTKVVKSKEDLVITTCQFDEVEVIGVSQKN